ncbi:hypothetical protein [Aliiroseovarius sp.]|uniref:hypothetical protein n=1 Tax=Aliiroseovarius sp. TaxID=1872442 RepID=UPI003BAA5169
MTIRSAVLGIGMAMIAGAAGACPNYNLYGDTYELHGSDLYNPQSVRLQAGGNRSITGCGIRFGSDRGRGYVTEAPDFSIRLSGMQRYSISFSVRSQCDSILLINTGAANWYYDDDDNGNYDAKITLTRPSNGWMDIWVGTHDGSVCDATLTLETFYR